MTTKPIVAVADVIWVFDRGTGKVEIVQDGKVLETCTLAEAPRRLAHHRNAVASASGVAFTEASAYKRRNRGA